jgi:adenine-specific DNA methylase
MGDRSDTVCPRLIEVALPIRELSAESVRDKNIHHAHISHLHIWWARRPLAASRAVVFASLVPDPDDARCPEAFKKMVEQFLRTQIPATLQQYCRRRQTVRDDDPYRPYHGMKDTPRNRLLMFIARWSREYLEFEAGRSADPPGPALLLDDRSLAKWETSDPGNAQGREVLRVARELIRAANDGRMPVVLDPFAGGGAIPLEVGRLGAEAIANDYNPVAHLVLRATCEYPQRYGKPGKRTVVDEEFGRKKTREADVPNMLVHDFERWANRILSGTREKIGHLYPAGKDGRPVLAYLWARTVPCANRCGGEIPLLRSLLLRSKGEKVALTFDVDEARKEIRFGIAKGDAVKQTDGTKAQRGPARCPFCREATSEDDLRRAAVDGKMKERMVAVVVQGKGEKDYRPVEDADVRALKAARAIQTDAPSEYIVPEINGPGASPEAGSHRSINLELYGFTRWGQLFSHRQLVVMDHLVSGLQEAMREMEREVLDVDYRRALATYLALWIDRVAAFGNAFTRWRSSHEKSETPFSGQSIPMMWDYPEVNPFADSSGTASTQLEYMLKVVLHEQTRDARFAAPRLVLGSATEMTSVESASCEAVVTDPPYGNSIAYADLSDFFYVWLKRSLGDLLPEVFRTPQTPKEQEATSHKHRHKGSQERANEFYRRLLTDSFMESKRAAKDPKLVTVMFAHQSTEAWTALLSALFDAGLCPDATWPIATEMPNTALAQGTASLETSVTVVCRPRVVGAAESFKNVKKEINHVVSNSVQRFWSYGFRGADLIVACYGPAVGVFGKYERVEKADGTRVEVPELLDLARRAARDAIAGEFRGDNLSTLYYIWANLYGAAEQSWDDARLVVQIGGDAESAMDVARRQGIFVVDGPKCRLALLANREGRRGLGTDPNPPLIDALHRAMLLWKQEKRRELVDYLAERDLLGDGPFWKLAQALFEVLPRDVEDWKIVNSVLGERETLRTEGKRTAAIRPQVEFNFGNRR